MFEFKFKFKARFEARSPRVSGGLAAAALAGAWGCGAAAPTERYEYSRMVMGVQARIILYADCESTGRRAAETAFERLDALERVMSDYLTESELTRVALRAAGQEVPISDDLYRVLARSGEISAASGGAFDVTLGPVVKLWREARATGRLPRRDGLAAALARTGWSKVRLEPRRRSVELAHGGMRLDLGGIGKGFAADEALGALRRRGVIRALVDIGGDIAAGEAPPGSGGWEIAVATTETGAAAPVLSVRRAAVAHSGDADQFVEIGGTRYSHILDPRSGMALTTRASATVLARDAATADALATCLCVLGPSGGFDLLGQFPGSSAMIEVGSDEGIERFTSDGFPVQPPPRADPNASAGSSTGTSGPRTSPWTPRGRRRPTARPSSSRGPPPSGAPAPGDG